MPLTGEVKVFDEIRGKIIFQARDLDDQVLMKSNGVPTYQFASVVDDYLMQISHVTRGDEWLASFPKNILLYEAFGWPAPKFIHLPLLLNKGGGKLSKRQGDVFVEDYRAKGYVKEAIINFCALLGWHPKGDQEILSFEELKNIFSISGLGSSPAIFDLEKLDFFNAYYLRQKPEKELIELAQSYLIEAGLPIEGEKLERAFLIARDRLKKLSDTAEAIGFFFHKPEAEKDLIVWKNNTLETAKNNLREVLAFISTIDENSWIKENLEEEVLAWVKREKEGRNGDYLWPLRTALSGLKNSPNPFEIAWVIGKEESLKRIEDVLHKL
jgi:glutamyl-tRNA synthetase